VSDTIAPVLSEGEIIRITGGYQRAADQLRSLHLMGFYRARIGKVSCEVVLERPHYDAVCAGQGAASNDEHQPKVRILRRAK
jgi:hypothetical protein